MILGEVAAPGALEGLGPLVAIAGLIVALSAIVLIKGLATALLQVIGSIFGHIPIIGSTLESGVTSLEHAITHALGVAISGIESRIGHQWHTLAGWARALWNEQVTVAHNLWNIARQFYGFANTNDVTRWVNQLRHSLGHIEKIVKTAVRKEVLHITKVVDKTVVQTVPGIKALRHAIDVTIPREIGGLWGQTKALTDSIGRLWDRVRSLEASASAAAIAAAVAAAVAALGLDWLRCSDGATRAGRSGCGLWSDLGSLFGWFVDLFVIADLCELIGPMETAFADVAAPAISALTSGIDQMPCVAGHQPPTLNVPQLALPPSPGITTYTP